MNLSSTFSTSVAPVRRSRIKAARRAFWWSLMLAGAGALGFGGWRYVTRPVSVPAARVIRGPVAKVVYATGVVEPRRPIEVSSRVTAPVTAVLANEGDHVVRGQALATLDAEDQRQGIAQLVAARINAEQDERRALSLFRQGWLANSGRDRAVAAANAARATEAAARAKVDQYVIRSAVSGVILRRDVEPGDLATAAKTLFEMGDASALRVTATVDERDIPLVRTGSAVMMSTEAYPGRVFRGRVYEITPGGDPDQRAFRVRIRPDDGSHFPIGLTLEVNIMVMQHEQALLVPAAAVRGGSVWIVDDGRAGRVPVQTGIRGIDRIEITSGLADRACVIAQPADSLKQGERVIAKGC